MQDPTMNLGKHCSNSDLQPSPFTIVLGAHGQLGSDIVKVFAKQKIEHVGLTRDNLNADQDNLSSLDEYNAKYIINCIATTNVDGCEQDVVESFAINTIFVQKLAKYCEQKQIILIHLSTDYVFAGDRPNIDYTENDQANPHSIYGISKYAGELLIQSYLTKHYIFRVAGLFGVAGASGKGGNFITTMLRLGANLDQVKVINDQITNPTSTLAVARVIAYFVQQNALIPFGIYHCVSQNSCSWYDFALQIFKHGGLDCGKLMPVCFKDYPFKAKRPQYSCLSITKLNSYIKMPTWQESLTEYFSLI